MLPVIPLLPPNAPPRVPAAPIKLPKLPPPSIICCAALIPADAFCAISAAFLTPSVAPPKSPIAVAAQEAISVILDINALKSPSLIATAASIVAAVPFAILAAVFKPLLTPSSVVPTAFNVPATPFVAPLAPTREPLAPCSAAAPESIAGAAPTV